MWIVRTLSVVIVICLVSSVNAKNVGLVGQTYEIAEQDALKEIQQHVAEADWKSILNKQKLKKMAKNYRPHDLRSVKRATSDAVFTVDLTYTLDYDIHDKNGAVLYPKGYSFNPLQYVTMPTLLVFIDGTDKRQIAWFKASPYAKDINTMLLLTGGSYYDALNALKVPVYYATADILDKFNVRHVPSAARQNGTLMEVHEFDVEKKSSGPR